MNMVKEDIMKAKTSLTFSEYADRVLNQHSKLRIPSQFLLQFSPKFCFCFVALRHTVREHGGDGLMVELGDFKVVFSNLWDSISSF